MPRLRYYKNFDYEAPHEDESDETTEISGRSWLSNAAIVGTLSNDKIKQAIKHYRGLITLLEAEILSRANSPQRHPAENRRTSRKLARAEASINGDTPSKGRQGNISAHSMRQMLRQLKLSPEAKRKLFEEWSKIQNGDNHGG